MAYQPQTNKEAKLDQISNIKSKSKVVPLASSHSYVQYNPRSTSGQKGIKEGRRKKLYIYFVQV